MPVSVDAAGDHYCGPRILKSMIWASSGARVGTIVAWARLAEIDLSEMSPALQKLNPAQAAAFAKDLAEGLTVFGLNNNSPERGRTFIEKDGGPAGQQVKKALIDACDHQFGEKS